MNCEWVKQNSALYAYDELPDDARHEMEMHLNKCSACQTEVSELQSLKRMMVEPVAEPSPNLLTASRLRLQEALETTEQSRGFSRWTMDVAGWLHQVRFSPALAMVLLMIGFSGGIVTTFATKGKVIPGIETPQTTSTDQASISSIQGITQTPGSNTVQIQYEKLVPDTASGSLDDPRIQQLLLYAARSNYNSGVRLDSIDMLTKKPEDSQVREALIFALRYDKNPGVRLKALDGLKAYVKTDVRVRDAVLEALLRDSNSGIRSEAIRSLQPVTADSSVRATLRALAEQDSNDYIRAESRRVLASLPEID
ncbi:MAG TPA: HEAT repeat domain-containing protein [Terriglobales bacterium]|nr:HEAT repeat domain-containing protein [Terriglobales bacterium]